MDIIRLLTILFIVITVGVFFSSKYRAARLVELVQFHETRTFEKSNDYEKTQFSTTTKEIFATTRSFKKK